jgi:hypothetical protein
LSLKKNFNNEIYPDCPLILNACPLPILEEVSVLYWIGYSNPSSEIVAPLRLSMPVLGDY